MNLTEALEKLTAHHDALPPTVREALDVVLGEVPRLITIEERLVITASVGSKDARATANLYLKREETA